jgi:GTP pyrophosphokinase
MNNRLKLAYVLAEFAHQDQKRKDGSPYIYHPWAVAETVKHLGEDYQITGVLHDIVEDTMITEDVIYTVFGSIIGRAVDSITRASWSYSGKEKYTDFILRAKKNEIGRQVKIADIKHNLSTLDGVSDENERNGLRKRWEEALKVLEA